LENPSTQINCMTG